MKPKAILFDVDGTLLDTREFLFRATEHSLGKHGFPVLPRELITTFVGKPLVEFYQSVAPTALETDINLLSDTHHEFQMENLHLAKSFPNIIKVLTLLKNKGIKMAAVTSRTNQNVAKTLEIAGVDSFLDVVITSDDVVNLKPHPEPLLKAMDLLGVKPEETWMVGDAEPDILAGKNAGTKTVGVTYGFGGKDIAKLHPDYLIENIQELLSVIQRSPALPDDVGILILDKPE